MGDLLKLIVGPILVPVALVVAGTVLYFFFSTTNLQLEPVISVMILLTPLWLPYLLFFLLIDKWKDYVRQKWVLDNGRSTLRIKLPQEVFKSPEAMEQVFSQIHNPSGADNLWQTFIDGRHALTFSFELVSQGGEIRFYVNVPTKKTKNAVEAALYAEYPGIEVTEETIDYTSEISWDPNRYEMMAFHIVKREDEIFPIKTYIDWGLDKLPKEEEKVEPMAPMIEQLGRIKPHERIWIQILATPHAKKSFWKTMDLKESGTWDKKADEHIGKLLGRDKDKKGTAETEFTPRLTRGEQDVVAAIERNVSKYAYEVGIRMLYITEKGKFNGDIIGPTLRTFAQYDVLKRNSVGVKWRSDFDYNWFSDYSGKKKLGWKKDELKDYKLRKYGAKKEGTDNAKVMSAEELATMFHLPGTSIVSPALPRILSTRKEAPPNLPTGLQTRI